MKTVFFLNLCCTSLLLGIVYPLFSAIQPNSPNFILILTDDQGWNGTSVQMMDHEIESKSDYHYTPHLEELSKKGMRFSNAYASAPVCSPSRYSIQFGQTPARLKMIRVGMDTQHINHQTPITIPKLLNKINPNYKTAHFGKWGIDVNPSVLGYDESDGMTGNKEGGFDHRDNKTQWKNNTAKDPKKIFSITQRALNFVERQAKSGTPFFLQLSHYAVHSDIISREETLEKYLLTAKGNKHKHPGFAAMTEDLDSSVGLLLDRIKSLGIESNTYIIYTSDNGAVPVMPPRNLYQKGSNYPLSRGKWDAMEGGIRVPFVISGPHIDSDKESKVPITFSDLLPTIVDLAGQKIPLSPIIDGGSFKKIVLNNGKGKIKRSKKGLIFHVPYQNKIALNKAHSAIRMDQYKLIKFYDSGELLLFDLNKDIKEQQNIAAKHPKKTKTLEKILDDYLKEVKAPKWKPGITWKVKSLEKINSYH